MMIGLWLLSGCGRCGEILGDPDVVYVGDSVLAWNESTCNSIGAHAATARGSGYTNVAVNGARVLGGSNPIDEQGAEGDFEWVVMNGGANDLNSLCACGDCDEVLDRLASSEGSTGALFDIAEAWRERDSEVLMLGYYPVKESAWYGFDICFETITELDRRVALGAAAREGVHFFDLGDVIDTESRGVFAFDHAHPSPAGAEVLGIAVSNQFSGDTR